MRPGVLPPDDPRGRDPGRSRDRARRTDRRLAAAAAAAQSPTRCSPTPTWSYRPRCSWTSDEWQAAVGVWSRRTPRGPRGSAGATRRTCYACCSGQRYRAAWCRRQISAGCGASDEGSGSSSCRTTSLEDRGRRILFGIAHARRAHAFNDPTTMTMITEHLGIRSEGRPCPVMRPAYERKGAAFKVTLPPQSASVHNAITGRQYRRAAWVNVRAHVLAGRERARAAADAPGGQPPLFHETLPALSLSDRRSSQSNRDLSRADGTRHRYARMSYGFGAYRTAAGGRDDDVGERARRRSHASG